MERAERVGLGVATIGHILLFGILSLGLVTKAKLPPLKNDPMDVVLVDAIGLRAAAPDASPEPPAPSEAPTKGKPSEAVAPTPAPPEPEPAPEPAPVPKPAPPKPAPSKPAPPKPAPPKPTPAKPTPAKPEPKPAPTKPAPPKPAPRPTPKPTPAKPVAKPAPAKPAPAKTAPAKPEPAKSAPARPAPAKPSAVAAAGDTRDRRRPDRAEEGGGAPSSRPAKPAGGKAGEKPVKAAGSRLGPDFLKGLSPEKGPGKSEKPAAAAVSAQAMQGLGAAIKRQVEPCYELGSLQGTPAMSIVTVLRLRFNKDGSVATAPVVVEQTGINGGNQNYSRQIAEVGRRAVLKCAPLKLPAELYEGGWEDIELRFIPGQFG